MPRILVELWIEDDFCGEYLLPELPELNLATSTRTLWPLVENASTPSFKTRTDCRKKTTTEVDFSG